MPSASSMWLSAPPPRSSTSGSETAGSPQCDKPRPTARSSAR
jgi:hypothetical protein